MSAFYKSNDAAVLAAIAAYEARKQVVRAAGKEFADYYGGKLLSRSDLHGYSIAGLCFQPAKDDPLWTKPERENAGMQRPRAAVMGATKEQRAALAELKAGWKARFPQEKADMAPVLAAMGTDWGNLFFSGFAMFQHDGYVYVNTSTKLATSMVEILGSEFHAARAAYDGAKAAA